jgi:hypothetical protein
MRNEEFSNGAARSHIKWRQPPEAPKYTRQPMDRDPTAGLHTAFLTMYKCTELHAFSYMESDWFWRQ